MRKIQKYLMIFLELTTVTLVINICAVNATEVPTCVFISVSPNPVGVNQTVSVIFWLNRAPPTAAGAAGDRWEGLTVTIIKPDNTTEIKGPYRSDAVGSVYFEYTPDQVGVYRFQAEFTGQTIAGVYYKPSQSRIVKLTVQRDPITPWPDYPLPTGYWTRPISAEFREWYKIAGNWLMPACDAPLRHADTGSAFNPYTTAPETPHIVWTKPITFGGIVGGKLGYGVNYYTGMSYELKFHPPVIIGGRLYYNIYGQEGFMAVPLPGVICVDLRTGSEIWRKDDMPRLCFGQVFNYESPNQHGASAYLWCATTTDWKVYDAFTATLLVTLKNASFVVGELTSNLAFGPHGEVLAYVLDGINNRLILWNSTKAIPPPMRPGMEWAAETAKLMWRPGFFSETDWKSGVQWNVSIPDVPGFPSICFVDYDDGVILAQSRVGDMTSPIFIHVGYDVKTGEQLWIKNVTNVGTYGVWLASPQPRDGVYAFFQPETMQWHVFDIKTGEKRFSTKSLNSYTNSDWSIYDWCGVIAYGKLFVTGYSGCVNAFDIETGEHLWVFSIGSSGLQTPYESWPLYSGITVADGKLYVGNSEHSPNVPLYLGGKLYCINASNGQLLWKISGWWPGGGMAVAEGYLVNHNGYDNRIYCFGKGPTQTTVSTNTALTHVGEVILIQGRVLDNSPGVNQQGMIERFPAGLPAVADDNMTSWMEYAYMQKPLPGTVEGVDVELYAIDETGQTTDIATVRTDPLNGGIFRSMWTPPKEGTYIITAVFAGSKSYWDSYASTAIGVTSAAPTAAAAVEALQPWNIVLTVLVVIAIVIGAANLYALRKRK
ncbi:MAG: PQQ-binding-like beta-propeller repeat protein [Thermoproteota archaeon]